MEQVDAVGSPGPALSSISDDSFVLVGTPIITTQPSPTEPLRTLPAQAMLPVEWGELFRRQHFVEKLQSEVSNAIDIPVKPERVRP